MVKHTLYFYSTIGGCFFQLSVFYGLVHFLVTKVFLVVVLLCDVIVLYNVLHILADVLQYSGPVVCDTGYKSFFIFHKSIPDIVD